MANKFLFLRTENSPFVGKAADITKNSVLTHSDVDNNFIFLKGEDILTGATSGNNLLLNKVNNDTIAIDLSSIAGGGGTNTFTTGFTYDNSNNFTILRNSGKPDLNVNVSTMTGLTINGALSATTISSTSISATTIDAGDILSGGTNLNSIFQTIAGGGGSHTSINSLSGAISLIGGTNITLATVGNAITINSSAGGGTVSNVAASFGGNAFSLAGSPITSTGTLAITPSGDATQYVNGLGNLVSISSIGGGTVSSVAASFGGDAFSLAGSPITTSGTLAITASGNATQYVNGLGNLALLSTIPTSLTLSTTGTNGAATLVGNTLNIPQYVSGGGGGGATGISAFSVASADNSTQTLNGAIKGISIIPDSDISVNKMSYLTENAQGGSVAGIKVGIYLKSSLGLLAYGKDNSTAATQLGLNTINLNTSITLSAGVEYYLAIYCNNNAPNFLGKVGIAAGPTTRPVAFMMTITLLDSANISSSITPGIHTSTIWLRAHS